MIEMIIQPLHHSDHELSRDEIQKYMPILFNFLRNDDIASDTVMVLLVDLCRTNPNDVGIIYAHRVNNSDVFAPGFVAFIGITFVDKYHGKRPCDDHPRHDTFPENPDSEIYG